MLGVFFLKMENKIVKFIKDVGANNQAADEYEVYEDYFTNRENLSCSDDSASEEEDEVNISGISCLKEGISQTPVVEEENILTDDDALIQIESDTVGEIINNGDNDNVVVVVVVQTCPESDSHVTSDSSELKINEINHFMNDGCGYQANCCNQFTPDRFFIMKTECSEIDYYENNVNKLDQVILGQLRCLTLDSSTTVSSHKKQTDRKKTRTKFILRGLNVCKNTFMFAHHIKVKIFKRLTKMYNDSGIIAKPHGNTGRSPMNVTSFERSENIVRFLNNYAEQNALILPGRVATVYNSNLKLLPSSDSKITVYNIYEVAMEESQIKPVSDKIFRMSVVLKLLLLDLNQIFVKLAIVII